MDTTCKQSLFALTRATGLYNLHAGSLVHAELTAYLAALEPLENRIRNIVDRAFVSRCDGEALARFESMTSIPVRQNTPLENRKKTVLYRLAANPNSFTVQGMLDCIRSVGMQAELYENFSNESLVVKAISFLNDYSGLEEIHQAIQRFLPAHLDYSLDVGLLTWEMFEQKDYTFQQLDQLDFDWEYFDTLGHQI